MKPFSDLMEVWQSWSLPNYVSCYINKSSCNYLTSDDIKNLKNNLTFCFRHKETILKCNSELIKKSALKSANSSCQQIPIECNNEFYYNIFQYLLSKEFFSDDIYVLIFLPILQYENMELLSSPKNIGVRHLIDFHEDINRYSKNYQRINLVGEAYGAKNKMFREYLIKDCVNLLISIALVSVIIFIYSGSIFFLMAVLITLIFSFGLAYFAYKLIFRIPFFSNVNLLVCILLIGVGADDTFVLHHIYYLYKKNTDRIFTINDVTEAFSNAAVSMFVTSATTAASFYSNYYSDIMVIKSFSIFAGCLMLANYLLVVSWLPASLILFDRHLIPFYYKLCSKKWHRWIYKIQLYAVFMPKTLFLETIMPLLIKKYRIFWVIFFSTTFVVSLILIFYKPGLQMSRRNLFKLFKDGNSFEWYEDQTVFHFEFRSVKHQQPQGLTLVWGFKPVDNTKTMDPYDSGAVATTDEFKISFKVLNEISTVCEKIDDENFTETFSHQSCFSKLFFQWSKNLVCTNDTVEPCCNYLSGFFVEENLGRCLAMATEKNGIVEYGGPLFKNDTFNVAGFVLYFDSILKSPLTYDVLGEYLDDLDKHVKRILADSSEPSIRHGWLIMTDYNLMALHDLQKSLVYGTPISVVISVVTASVILILMTKNFLLTIFGLLSVVAVISVTIASLVCTHWSLNFVEATICILTVGLSFDFTLHYLVGYQLAPLGKREEKVFAALTYIGLPVLLSALTTLLAGCAMLPSTTMVFYQTGIFMVVVSIVSWFYSSFFFVSLLSLFGPEDGSCLDYHFICFSKRRPSVTLQGTLGVSVNLDNGQHRAMAWLCQSNEIWYFFRTNFSFSVYVFNVNQQIEMNIKIPHFVK